MSAPNTMDSWYTRCPACGLVAPPQAAESAETAAGAIDWSRPDALRLCCGICGHWHPVEQADLLPLDFRHACRRCQASTPVPVEAAEVVCLGCHLHAPGPAARDKSVAQSVATTRLRHDRELRARFLLATGRSDTTAASPRPGGEQR